MGALGPLGKVAGYKKQWLIEATAYTLAGSLASALVGALLGMLGKLLLTPQIGSWGILVALAFGLVAIARELRWISFSLPQFRRQTVQMWGKIWPGTVAAVLWGLDLGLIFTTRVTFSGAWLLVVVVTLVRDPTFGAALFVLYWLGRASSVWIAPVLMVDAHETWRIIEGIHGYHRLFQRLHLAGLIWSTAVLVVWLIHETSA